ncbi:MAG: hypothetical protein MK212_03710, partial [Saprospiraceae bacterium]|nr:hypothetical protein [Saprospiraceae bacterium]
MILKTFLLCSVTLAACAFDTAYENEPPPKFDEYWYAGKAELSSYTIKQSRYGEYREGTSVFVYVTEDFSNSKQVKLDNPSRNQDDVVSVLKLNQMRKFATGVYDYSIMQSTFTPVDCRKYPHTIKSVLSVQDWCGQSFTQLNLQTYKYKITQRSYFETEGDDEFQIEKNFLEDEVWNLIRIDPEALPIGNIQLIPSMISAQLLHSGLRSESANASLQV